MKTKLSMLVLAGLILSAPVHGGDRVIARVGLEPITYMEVQDLLEREPALTRQAALDLLIDRKLVLGWASANRIQVTEPEIDETIDSIRQRNGLSPRQFEEALSERGETPDTFRKAIREQLIINKAFGTALTAQRGGLEAEVQDLYQKKYPRQRVYKVSHILLSLDRDAPPEAEPRVKKKAEELLAELRNGASFEKLASTYSDDPTSAPNGGALGAFHEGELLPELEQAVADLEPGEVAGPVRTSAGYHLVLLSSRDWSDPPPLAQVRDELTREVLAEKEEAARKKWLSELRKSTFVEVFPDEQ